MPTAPPRLSPRFVTLLLTLFFLSGVSGLMYEVVWVRMLTRILGSTSYATSTVLGVFMGGLALGSWLAGRFVDRVRRPLWWYAGIEVGIALAALCSLALPEQLVPVYRSIYDAADGSRAVLTFGQVLVAVGVLLVPTLLMGATLPTLTAFGSRRFENFHRYVSLLYALNTLGAVIGVLCAGFVLLGTVGETATIVLGAVLNVGVGIAAATLALRIPSALRPAPPGQCDSTQAQRATDDSRATTHHAPRTTDDPPLATHPSLRLAVLLAFAANGFIALANEVIWGRMLVLYQGTSIYAFSSMLSVVLAGIALGSWWGGRRLHDMSNPFRTYALVQVLAGLAGIVALFTYGGLAEMARPSFLHGAHLKVLVTTPILLLGPMSFLWGVGFPVAARCYAQAAGSAGRDVSSLYAWNTLGSILGALAGGFVFISTLGVSHSAVMLAMASVAVGCGLLLVEVRSQGAGEEVGSQESAVSGQPPAVSSQASEVSRAAHRSPQTTLALAAMACVLAIFVGDPYFRIISHRIGQRVVRTREKAAAEPPTGADAAALPPQCPPELTVHHHSEGATGTTTAFTFNKACGKAYEQLWINGEGMTHLCVETKLMAHLPLALCDDPRRVCVVCCGMGTSLKSAVVHDVEAWCVELVPAVFDCLPYFHPDAADLLSRPDVHAVVDDGRNYLQMNERTYDVITIDPAPPFYSAGTVNLYTREFFRLAKSRLTDGGVFCLWIPPWEKREVAFVMRTYLDVFEHVRVWSGPGSDGFPKGFYLMGRRTPFPSVAERIVDLYKRPGVVEDLREWDTIVDSPEEALALQLTDGEELSELLAGVPVMSDDRPYTEFPLFRSLAAGDPLIFTGDVLRTDLAARRGGGGGGIGNRRPPRPAGGVSVPLTADCRSLRANLSD